MARAKKKKTTRAPKAPPRRKHARPKARTVPARKAAKQKIISRVRQNLAGTLSAKLYDAALRVLKDRQAEEIVSVELEGRSSVADYLIIASGRAGRQIAAIADHLREAFMKLGVPRVRVEGLPEANWVLVDAGDVVVHLFRPEVRSFYNLEGVWREEEEDEAKAALLLE